MVNPFVILKDAIWKYYEDDGPFMARSLAFGLLIYCIPLALLTVSALSYTLVSSERALGWVRNVSLTLMPQFYDQFTAYLTDIINNRGVLGAVGFGSLVLVTSATFGSIRIALNKVFKGNETRGIIRGKAMEIAMMMATSALTLGVITIIYAITIAQGIIASRLPVRVAPNMVLIGNIGGFAATTGLFWFLYAFSAAKRPGKLSVLIGALTSAGLFELSKIAFAWYVRSMAGTPAVYGTLSGLVFFFLWMYYACVVFLIGAEVAWTVENRKQIKRV